MRKIEDYFDIINLPHHKSRTRKQMSLNDRAAQFAPFAALSGHDDEMKEVARLTSDCSILTPEKIDELNYKVQVIKLHLNTLNFKIVYFEKDMRKSGGKYLIYNGKIKDIDEMYKVIIVEDEMIIKISDIVDIDGDLFNIFDD